MKIDSLLAAMMQCLGDFSSHIDKTHRKTKNTLFEKEDFQIKERYVQNARGSGTKIVHVKKKEF